MNNKLLVAAGPLPIINKIQLVMYTYDTVTEAIADLNKRGYIDTLNIKTDCLICGDRQITLNPEQFNINEVYRFEGETDPGDETIVYAISSRNGKIKGTLVNGFGTYADTISEELVRKLNIKRA
ncbi:phosphoribosylpyrophosphate synthetase [Segetibacter aerophilus]|uniref:Phosphoribosylpyrophosphate synthetase n=1 Tax=Segetibacter aerophilus TaxID=670293 RepID=A0A512BGW9_9BACT|nr:phosphoribosylpyrophosphate synthetase [Segetibacter aerophilus]GEO11209.1 hypothetical protein SAE01_37050 [Segetibacter aerophilus]